MSNDVESGPLEEPAHPSRRKALFGALKFGDFRLLWFSLLFSNLGSWMQITAVGYLVVHLTKTTEAAALWLGIMGLAQAVPALLISPIAGVVADVLPRRTVLWNTNAISVLCAVFLSAMVMANFVGLLPIVFITFVASAARAIDAPARQSWVPQLVDREYVGNAIGLNSLAFNAPSVVGPAIAGLLIGSFDISVVFIANAILTFGVVCALTVMQPAPRNTHRRPPFLRALREGLEFLVAHKTLRIIISGLFICALFTRPYLVLLPAFALTVLGTNAFGLGLLYGASGVGAIIGALATAYIGNVPYRMQMWMISGGVFAVSVILIGYAQSLIDTLPWLVIAGCASMIFTGSTNILVQTLAPEHLRGRAIAAYSLILLGIVPLGAMVLGYGASNIGLRIVFEIGGLLFLLFCIASQFLFD